MCTALALGCRGPANEVCRLVAGSLPVRVASCGVNVGSGGTHQSRADVCHPCLLLRHARALHARTPAQSVRMNSDTPQPVLMMKPKLQKLYRSMSAEMLDLVNELGPCDDTTSTSTPVHPQLQLISGASVRARCALGAAACHAHVPSGCARMSWSTRPVLRNGVHPRPA